MDFEQLKTFLEVARQKSFSRAAERLLVTQPAISAQIRSLEKEVGARLFDRDGGKVTFTAAGRVFEPFAEHCLNCQSHILGIVAELHRSPRGAISISANEATCLYVLPAVFAQFRKQFLRVGLSIVRAERSRTLEAVLNREVDFGVVALPVKDPRLTVEPIHKDELAFVVPANHPLTFHARISLKEVAQHPLVLMKQGRQRELLDNLFRMQDLQPKLALEVESSELVKRLVEAGLGTGFLPRANVLSDAEAGLLKIVPVDDVRLSRDLALIYRKGKDLTRAAQVFLDIAKGQLDD
ncbi:MAG TPA: LysR family transcriptional regulator [Acidisarcina sp.]|nr:LysR family transcriptional regulator [Acidisarcina sp.]